MEKYELIILEQTKRYEEMLVEMLEEKIVKGAEEPGLCISDYFDEYKKHAARLDLMRELIERLNQYNSQFNRVSEEEV